MKHFVFERFSLLDSEEAGFVVYQVPANISSFDLNDVKNFLIKVTKDDSTVENCRPKSTVVSLKVTQHQFNKKDRNLRLIFSLCSWKPRG